MSLSFQRAFENTQTCHRLGRFFLENSFTSYLQGEKPKNRKIDSECLNMFLNPLFNANSAPSDRSDECIRYSEVGSNQGSMPELVLFHGIFSLHLCLQVPSLNNAVYVISVSQALITIAQSGRSVMSVFSVFSCQFSVPVFFSKPPHPNLSL